MNLTAQNTNLLKTKQHFEILDGLRGLAAIVVVVFHFMEIIIPEYKDNFIAHGYLAVDFFFCLSGFVIAYSYDNRVEKMGFLQFLKLRLIRLHPLVIIGSVIGLLGFVFDPFSNLSVVYGFGKTLLMFLTSCLMIPYPIVGERFFNLFHLNPPTWSLFWEYIANLFYALFLFRLRNKVLWVLTVIAAALLFYDSSITGHLSVGWSKDNFWGGGIRIFYSFLMGMLIYRSNWIIKYGNGFISMCLLLLIAFLFPYSDKINWISDPVTIIFYFPFLVALGAGARLSPRFKKICKFSGDISYPLYMTHYPFMWIFLSYVELKKPPISQMIIITLVGTILLIGLAWVIMTYLDIPLRTYFKNRMKKNWNSIFPKQKSTKNVCLL